jgi:hypothetical protein
MPRAAIRRLISGFRLGERRSTPITGQQAHPAPPINCIQIGAQFFRRL